jgi:hypothetical protein
MPQATDNVPERDAGADPGANDDDQPPPDAIAFTDLVLAAGVDEDTLLQRLAVVLSKREDTPDDGSAEK